MKYTAGRVLVALFAISAAGCGVPSDAAIESLLKSHLDECTRMVAMMAEDESLVCVRKAHYVTLLAIGGFETTPGPDLSSTRWNEYRRLFDVLGLHGGVCRPVLNEKGERAYTALEVSGVGLVFGGRAKGLVYAENEPEGDASLRFTRIQEGWYIFEDSY